MFYIEFFNEILFMIVIYHMVYFTVIVQTWELDGSMQYKIGSYLLYTVGTILTINLVYALYQAFMQSLSEMRKKASQKRYEEEFQARKNAYIESLQEKKFNCHKLHSMKFMEEIPDDYDGIAYCDDCQKEIKKEKQTFW